MLSSQTTVSEPWTNEAPGAAPTVQTTLATVKRLDRWIFSRTNEAREIDVEATLARFTSLFDCIVGGPAATNRTLAKLLAAALLIAIGRRSCPVWFEAALVFRSFVRLCRRASSDGRNERTFLRALTAFHQSYMRCHMLALSDASLVLSYLQGRITHHGDWKFQGDVDHDLCVYMSLPRPQDQVCVTEKWPGPRNPEWQDASLMTWLYGRIYDQYAEAIQGTEKASSVDAANNAVKVFADALGVHTKPGSSITEARGTLDELMQSYTDSVNAIPSNKEARGAIGSGSVLDYIGYVKERNSAADIMMEYFVNIVCQLPTFESSQYLPEAMRQVALAVLQLQVQLANLVDTSQLSGMAHLLYARLERHEQSTERGPVDMWINDAVKLYFKFEDFCGPDMRAVNSAILSGRV